MTVVTHMAVGAAVGTITDNATGLMWSQDDSGDGVNTGPRSGMLWEDALAWVAQKNAENYLGHDDWRLPDVKELQSLLDYSHAPLVDGMPAIDPVFESTAVTVEDGSSDYAFYWSGTSHVNYLGGSAGCYVWPEDRVLIRRSDHPARFVRLADHEFFHLVSSARPPGNERSGISLHPT